MSQTAQSEVPETKPNPAPTLSRDEMRAKIFGAKPKSEEVKDFFGTTLELRQPTLAVALSQRNNEEDDKHRNDARVSRTTAAIGSFRHGRAPCLVTSLEGLRSRYGLAVVRERHAARLTRGPAGQP